jgi:Ca-activated chloride channel homolog
MKMKIKGNILISIMSVVLVIVLMIPAFIFVQKNPISKSNRLKSKAKDEYINKEYVEAYHSYKLLIDSLALANDAASMNYANSAYLSSALLMKGLKEAATRGSNSPDSTLIQIGAVGKETYSMLTGSSNESIASMAANQLGYATLKGTNIFEGKGDSALFAALEYFKTAVRKDPANDSARYNYELVKKIIDFPETVMAEARAMVAQKKYIEAAKILENGMRKDPRLRQQQDFMQRLRTVISIDSLKGRGT